MRYKSCVSFDDANQIYLGRGKGSIEMTAKIVVCDALPGKEHLFDPSHDPVKLIVYSS